NNNLSRVGRVGENFLVAGDGSIKNDFAVAFAFGAVAFASEDSPVFQRKDCLHSRSGEWIFRILAGNCAAAKRRTLFREEIQSAQEVSHLLHGITAARPPECSPSAVSPSA